MKDQATHKMPKPESVTIPKIALPFRSFHTVIEYGGGFLASDEFSHKLIYFDLNGTVETLSDKLELSTSLRYPRGMVTIDGAVWLCDSWNNRIVIFEAMPEKASAIPVKLFEYPFFDEPSDLCRINERIIVANKSNNTLCTLQMSGDAEWIFPVESSSASAKPPKPFPPSVADTLADDESIIQFRRPSQIIASSKGLIVVDREQCHLLPNAARIDSSRQLPPGLYERGVFYINPHLILLDDCTGTLLAINDSGKSTVLQNDFPIEACWAAGNRLFCAQANGQFATYRLESIKKLLNGIHAEEKNPEATPALRETLEITLGQDITAPEIAKHKNIIKTDDGLRKTLFEQLLKSAKEKFKSISENMEAIASGNIINDLINLNKPPDPMPIFNANLVIDENTNYSENTNKRIRNIINAAESIGKIHRIISLQLDCAETAVLSGELSTEAISLHQSAAQGFNKLHDALKSALSDSGDLTHTLQQHRTFILQYGLYIHIRRFALTSIMFHDHIRGSSVFSYEEKRYEGSFLSPPTWHAVAKNVNGFGAFCECLKKCNALYEHYKEKVCPATDETRTLIFEQWRLILQCQQIVNDKFFISAPLISNKKTLRPLFEANGETFDDKKPVPWKNPDESLLLGIISDDPQIHNRAEETFIKRYISKPAGCVELVKRLWAYTPDLAFDFVGHLQEHLASGAKHGWSSTDFARLQNAVVWLKNHTLAPAADKTERDEFFRTLVHKYNQYPLANNEGCYSGSVIFSVNETPPVVISDEALQSGELYDEVDSLDSRAALPPREILRWQIASNTRDYAKFERIRQRQYLHALSKSPPSLMSLFDLPNLALPKKTIEEWLINLHEYLFHSLEYANLLALKRSKFMELGSAGNELARLEEMKGVTAETIFRRLLSDRTLPDSQRQKHEEQLRFFEQGRFYIRLSRGINYCLDGKFTESLEALKEVPLEAEHHPSVLMVAVRAHIGLCNYTAARHLLDKIVLLYPYFVAAHEMRGTINLELENSQDFLHSLYACVASNILSPLVSALIAVRADEIGYVAFAKRVFLNIQNLETPPSYFHWINFRFALSLFGKDESSPFFQQALADRESANSESNEALFIFSTLEQEKDPKHIIERLESRAPDAELSPFLSRVILGEFAYRVGDNARCLSLLADEVKTLPSLQLLEHYAEARRRAGEEPDHISFAIDRMRKHSDKTNT